MKKALSCVTLLLLAGAGSAGPPGDEEKGEGVTLTVYNQNFVVVRERRLMDLKQGRGEVRFREVAATIVPETVQFSLLKGVGPARVVEQSYEFDLVSAAKLLGKYLDRDIAVITRDGGEVKGKLLSFDDGQLVLQTAAGVELVPRGDNVKDIRLSELPKDLLTRPTLVWRLDAAAGGQGLAKVSYAAGNMTWRVDYRARVNAAGDRLDLAGWVTVTNQTGTTFKDAKLRLMAGDVNLVKDVAYSPDGRRLALSDLAARDAQLREPAITGKSFSEYHLYELSRPATLKDSSTKQIELLDVEGIPLRRRYTVPARSNRVVVTAEFTNEEQRAKGLGVPLPRGPVRVFQRGGDGGDELVGQDAIDHTPKGEKVRLALGTAFDVVARRKQLAERVAKDRSEEDHEVRLRNHKKEPVTVEVFVSLDRNRNWKVLRASHPQSVRDAFTLMFPVTVPANAEAVLIYTIRYGDFNPLDLWK